MKKYQITKSIFKAHLQCPKKAYQIFHDEGESAPISSDMLALLEGGQRVGMLARDLYPGGYDATKNNTLSPQESFEYTIELLKSRAGIIYEAAFQSNNRLFSFKADILILSEGHLVEVKSSTSVKNEQVLECGFYHRILSAISDPAFAELGIQIRKYSIIYLNKEYVKSGDLDLKKLFLQEDISTRVIKCQGLVKQYMYETIETLRLSKVPEIKVSENCNKPDPCIFKPECFHYLQGQDSVLNIMGMQNKQKFYLINRGIITMGDLPRDKKMNAKQVIQVEAHINGRIHMEWDWLAEYLRSITTRRLVFMDFETYNEPIPQFDGVRPYQQIPFQYSVHVFEDGVVEHKEFLGQPGTDPREEFIIKLIKDVGEDGFIVTYNQAFELARLRELAEAFPKYSDQLLRIIVRVRDLMIPFRKLKLYSPKMKGSYSLKAVLPAFITKLSYADLSIKSGATASAEFMRMAKMPPKDQEKSRKELLAYCKMDTEALVEVWSFIRKIIENDKTINHIINQNQTNNEKRKNVHRQTS